MRYLLIHYMDESILFDARAAASWSAEGLCDLSATQRRSGFAPASCW
jgi:hypothetical protein